MSPDEPRKGGTTLIIKVVEGKVVGESVQRMGDGEVMVQRWQYLKITPEGMTWGNMNGMRPRGVNLFEGKLKGDTLEGTVRFGGISFRRPDGSVPEPLHFSFKRVRK